MDEKAVVHFVPFGGDMCRYSAYCVDTDIVCGGFPGSSAVKALPAASETRVQSLHQQDSLEEDMATHSRTLA